MQQQAQTEEKHVELFFFVRSYRLKQNSLFTTSFLNVAHSIASAELSSKV
ncbi:hypothetical protein [Enterococcus villorum]|nr:hypothetical protein [Enterococcus villorum]